MQLSIQKLKEVSEAPRNWVFEKRFKFLLAFTVLILLAASFCRIPGLIDHPQFTNKLDGNFVKQLLIDNGMMWSYWAFFIIDFIWAFILLLSIWVFVRNFVENQEDYGNWIQTLLKVFGVITIAAYVFDVWENVLYLSTYEYPKRIADIKTILYGVVILVWLLVVIKQYYKQYYRTILRFFKSAFYSLMIIIIIGVLLPKASQVNSIVVNLYMKPYNLGILLLVAAPIYAVMLAHYPTYFNIDKSRRKWYRAKWHWQLISTVFYKNDYDKHEKNAHIAEGSINFMLRILGILFYAALFYFVAFTSETNFHWPLATSVISVSMLLLGVYLLYYLREEKQQWLEKNVPLLKSRIPFYDGDFNDEHKDMDEAKDLSFEEEAEKRLADDLEKLKNAETSLATEEKDSLKKILPHIKIYGYVITITVVSTIAFIAYLLYQYITVDATINESLYTEWTAIISLVCIVLQTVSYIYYRTFRSIFRLVFFDEDRKTVVNAFYVMRVIEVDPEKEVQLTQAHLDTKEDQLKTFYDLNPFGEPKGILKLLDRLNMGIFSNNIFFLQATAIFGMFNTGFFLLLNLTDELPFYFNAALIILSALFLYYGMLVVITKNFIFYKFSKERYAVRNRQLFNFYLIIGFVMMLVLNVLTTKLPNKLFVLEPIDRQEKVDELTLEDYTKALKPTKTKYYIGAYGGGMKSNAWTLTVLDELYKKDTAFLEKAVVMSGASGGTIGITNWSAIMKEERDRPARTKMITDISTEHVLSMDLTHILGRDLVNYMFVPYFDKSGQDRSSKAMERYAKLADNEAAICSSKSYRGFWKEVYTANKNQYPIIISNSTNVRGNQGMAVSVGGVHSTETSPSLLYQNADNILELQVYNDDAKKVEPKTISYYNAASTSNRFPLISPAAKIPTLGHFNDGGIYENSGLLSAFKLFRQINDQPGITDLDCLPERNVFISIVNDKNAYIKKTVQDWIKDGIRIKKINPNTELNAIFNSVSSTEMMPIFIKTELERLDYQHQTIDFKTIYLPHQFNIQDIKDIYGLELISKKTNKPIYEALYECVQKNNANIRKWRFSDTNAKLKPIIEPPMSRVMAPQAYEFMQKMVLDSTPAGKMIKEISEIE